MNEIIEKRVGENIKRLRLKANLTQDAVATKMQLAGCDITRSAIAKIEVGQRHLYVDEIMLLQNLLHTTYNDIFDIKEK